MNLSVEMKRADIIIAYFDFIKNKENAENPSLSYKLLKCVYYLNMKGKKKDLKNLNRKCYGNFTETFRF